VSRAPNLPLGSLDPALLELPLSALNLTVRACHCLSDVPTIAALMECAEAELMRRRNFGRVTLSDVRRKLVAYLGERMAPPTSLRVRAALAHPPPAVALLWQAPPQPRPLAEVVAELLELFARRTDLAAVTAWRPAAHRIGPPPGIDPESATLACRRLSARASGPPGAPWRAAS